MLVWAYIKVLEWVMFRNVQYSELYAADIMAGNPAAPVTPELLFESLIDADFSRTKAFEALQNAESSILLKARNGEIEVLGTSPTGSERKVVPPADFEGTHIATEIVAERQVEFRLCPIGSGVYLWKDLLFIPSQVKKLWPEPESNPKGAGRKVHPAKRLVMFWLEGLILSPKNSAWLRGKQKRQIRDRLIHDIETRNKVGSDPIDIPARSTLDSWIDEWLETHPQARRAIGRKWAERK